MKSISKKPKQKTQLISYYAEMDPSLSFENLSLIIGGESHLLVRDNILFFIFNGNIILENGRKEKTLHFKLHGSSTEENNNIKGKINLKFQGLDFGYYFMDVPVVNGEFNFEIGNLPFNIDYEPEAAIKYKQSTKTKAGIPRSENGGSHSDEVLNLPKSLPGIFDKKTLKNYIPSNPIIHKNADAEFTNESVDGDSDGYNGGEGNIGDDEIDYDLISPDLNEDSGGEVTVFYGTNRNRTGDKPKDYYGNDLAELQQGLCNISIPQGHKQGELERPGKILWWQRKEDPAKHIVLKSISTLKENEFYDYLVSGLNKTGNKSALLFVHGFNTSFEEAAWRCGQICYDIPFPGITGFFAWPSAGKTIDYARDVERAEASVSCLTKFIEDLITKTGVEELHFIGHSMGNRILTRSLNQLFKKQSFKSKIKKIAQVVLAAPDIDIDVFNNEIYPTFKKIGKRRTIYASDKDMALFLSEKMRMGLKRVGEGGKNIYVIDGVDSVDASNVMSGGIHHSYMFEEKELLYDLNMILLNGEEPKKRRLLEKTKQVKDSTLKYWLFRE